MKRRKRAPKLKPNDVHRLLIHHTAELNPPTPTAAMDDDWTPLQALFCPYYVPLEGVLGGDWGVIVNPESAMFGRLVFEHHWCGCPLDRTADEPRALHGMGSQRVDEWVKR